MMRQLLTSAWRRVLTLAVASVVVGCGALSPAVAVAHEAEQIGVHAATGATEETSDQSTRLIVQFEEKDRTAVLDALARIPETHIRYEYTELLSGVSVETPASNMERIRHIPGVSEVEESRRIKKTLYEAKDLAQIISDSPKYSFDGRGMVIALIDSGVDTKHKDMRLDDDVLKNEEYKIKEVKSSVEGTYTTKVPWGYNYVDNNDDLKDGTDHPHGMHLAGILAGNAEDEDVADKTGIDGVAPNAQLLAYKIFSDNPLKFKSETSDAAYAAMEDAVKHGADVISLSVGYYDSGLPGNAYYKIAQKAAEKGIVIAAAIGNASTSDSTTSYDTTANSAFGLIDQATTVGVAATPWTIGVGSVRNTHLVYSELKVEGLTVGYRNIGKSKLVPGDYEVAYVPDASSQAIANMDLKGKVVITPRQDDDVRPVATNLKNKNVAGIIFVNANRTWNRDYYATYIDSIHNDDIFSYSKIWGITVSGNDGKALIDTLNDTQKQYTFQADNSLVSRQIIDRPVLSGFSSWGPTVNLELKPEIVAPGEDIYSTQNDNGYATMSGTSMAAPMVAGASALLLPTVRGFDAPEGVSQLDLFKMFLMNTAVPVIDHDGLENSPRQQGAGLMQLANAMDNKVVVYSGAKAAAELKEIDAVTEFDFTVHNLGDDPVSFDLSAGKVLTTGTQPVVRENKTGTEAINEVHSQELPDSSISLSEQHVELGAKEKTTVHVTLDAGQASQQFAEGFIYLNSTTQGQPDLSLPYFGFVGEWSHERIVDLPNWEQDSKTKLTSVMSTYKYLTSGKFIELGHEQLADNTSAVNEDDIAIGNTGANNVFGSAYLRFALLRDIVGYDIDIVQEPTEDAQILRRIDTGTLATRYRHIDFFEDETYRSKITSPHERHVWDGRIYDPSTGEEVAAADGQYYFRLRVKNAPEGPYQYTYLPVKIDNQAPAIIDVDRSKLDSDGTITVTASDNNKVAALLATLNGTPLEVEKTTSSPADTDAGNQTIFTVKNVKVSSDDVNKLHLEALDIAGNTAASDESLTQSHMVFSNPEVLTKEKSLETDLEAQVSDGVKNVMVYLDGVSIPSTLNNGQLSFSLADNRPQDGTHSLKFVLYGDDGEELETVTHSFTRDFTRPEVSWSVLYDKSEDDGEGEGEDEEKNLDPTYIDDPVQIGPNGEFTIKGTVKDNLTAVKDIRIVYYAGEALSDTIVKRFTKETITPNADGSFELNLFKSSFPNNVIVDIFDAQNNKTQATFKTERPVADDDDDADDDENPIILQNSGEFTPITSWGAEALEDIDDPHSTVRYIDGKYYFFLKYMSHKPGYQVKVNDQDPYVFSVKAEEGEEPDEDAEPENIEIPVEFTEGFNVVDISEMGPDGELLKSRKYHIYADFTPPELTIDNVIEPTSEEGFDGVIYGNEDGLVTVKGSASDNGINWYLRINGNWVRIGGIWREFGGNEESFTWDLHEMNAQSEINIRLSDRGGHEVFKRYRVAIDDEAPVIKVLKNSIANGATYDGAVTPAFEITDNRPNVSVSYTLNDEPYVADTAISDPGMYTLRVTARDDAGNVTEESFAFEVKKAKEGPESGDTPGGSDPSGDIPGGDTPGGDEPGGHNPSGTEPGQDNPSGQSGKPIEGLDHGAGSEGTGSHQSTVKKPMSSVSPAGSPLAYTGADAGGLFVSAALLVLGCLMVALNHSHRRR